LKLEFSAKFFWLEEERNRMKASKFTEAQKAFVLKQGEAGTPVAEICRKAGISQATYFNWKNRSIARSYLLYRCSVICRAA
jgi:putative transposase